MNNSVNDLFAAALGQAPKNKGGFDAVTVSEPAKEQDLYFADKSVLSNSFLKGFDKPNDSGFSPAYRFGSIVDAYFTEPDKFDFDSCTEWELGQLCKMHHALKNDAAASKYFGAGYWEWLQGWNRDLTPALSGPLSMQKVVYGKLTDQHGNKYANKIKIDCLYNKKPSERVIVDIKSTTCQTKKEFLKSCDNLNYWQQADIYLQSYPSVDFVFVAISYCNYQFKKGSDSIAKLAMKGVKTKMDAIVQPSKVFVVRWSELTSRHAKTRRLINDRIELGKSMGLPQFKPVK